MTSTPTRVPLTRERILETAVRIADAEGIEALSMRRLAQELGVQAMSLYNHVANKDAIRSGLMELVTGEIDAPTPGGDWKAELRRSAVSAHATLLRHRWAASLMMTTASASGARMRWMEAVLGTLRQAGFSAELTDHAYHVLDSHITGFALWQVGMPFRTREELLALAETFLPQIPEDEFPYVVEHAREHLREDAPSGAEEFAFGLDLILDGLERMLPGAE